MSSTRASSMRGLKYLSAYSRQTRHLHMTGPATFPSPLLTTERPAVALPKDLNGLRYECMKRSLPVGGTKADLTARLQAADLVQSRSFTAAVDSTKRPTPPATDPKTGERHFNTSRSLKAVNDTSTIDFAYMPESLPKEAPNQILRVPLLPQVSFNVRGRDELMEELEEAPPMRPEISTVSADSTHIFAPSALTDVTDNSAIDFQGMATAVSDAAKRLRSTPAVKEVEESASVIKTVWNDLLDDLMGPKREKVVA
ncbi:hypothetical protein K490DRAFT_66968 [Saccharata proteae CBS 121410]|uniref:SAP domain-containing protein n=1 Tax=Saccharata proteae CBS 121410 TaxID=1314787 RepID=A0A9P4LVK4_9PEZI|nr:hypothetical protein K490DRAFT_66968 [Saccharata proteae CBS 121410]